MLFQKNAGYNIYQQARYLHRPTGRLVDIDLRSNCVMRVDLPAGIDALQENAYLQPVLLQSNTWRLLARGLRVDVYLHTGHSAWIQIDRRSMRLIAVNRPAATNALLVNAFMPAALLKQHDWQELGSIFDQATYLHTPSGTLIHYNKKVQRIVAINEPAAVRQVVANAYIPETLPTDTWELLSRTFQKARYRNRLSRIEICIDEKSRRILLVQTPENKADPNDAARNSRRD